MANYKSGYTGNQIDNAVGSLTNKNIEQALGGALYRDTSGNFSIIINETEAEGSATLSLVNRGEKYQWNHILDSEGKLPVSRLPLVAGESEGTSATAITTGERYKIGQALVEADKGTTVASLVNGKIPETQLPSYVDDVLEFANIETFPNPGEAGKIYVALDTNKTYRWGGSTYTEISASLALGETSATAYRGDYGAAAYAHGVTNKGSEYSTKSVYQFKTNSEGHVIDATAINVVSSVVVTPTASSGNPNQKIGSIQVDGSAVDLYAPYAAMGPNTQTTDGYVTAPTSSNPNKFWGTDSTGAPGWTDVDVSVATSTQITLSSSNWASATKTQSATVQGVTATNTIMVSPIPSDLDNYAKWKVLCTQQAMNTLVFHCDTIPTDNLTVNILIID